MTKKEAEIFLLSLLEDSNRRAGYIKQADRIKATLVDKEFRAVMDSQVDEEIADYMRDYFWTKAKEGQ